MSELSPETVAAAVMLVSAFLYVTKRLLSFDLELRSQRERRRRRLAEERAGRVSAERWGEWVAMRAHDYGIEAREHYVPFSITSSNGSPLRGELARAEFLLERIRASDEALVAAEQTHPDEDHVRIDGTSINDPLIARIWRAVVSPRSLSARPGRRGHNADVPAWALALLDPAETDRCAREWAAHLHERVTDGELRQARVDRHRFIRYALVLAISRRARQLRKSL